MADEKEPLTLTELEASPGEAPKNDQPITATDLDVVYGIPKSVNSDGVINLNYRFLRVIDATNYNLYTFSYGRVGEAYKYTGK